MPAWLLPAVKLILPHVTDIVKAAKPAFTRLTGKPLEEQGSDVVQRQIAELQAAASQNATHVKELAEQLRLTVTALEQAAATAEKRLKRVYALAIGAVLVSIAALGTALYAMY
jgi:hypothetical protein